VCLSRDDSIGYPGASPTGMIVEHVQFDPTSGVPDWNFGPPSLWGPTADSNIGIAQTGSGDLAVLELRGFVQMLGARIVVEPCI
jgi:hypothetical protein